MPDIHFPLPPSPPTTRLSPTHLYPFACIAISYAIFPLTHTRCLLSILLQDIPLHVAMISHILIAWDRMRWLNDPLKGRIPGFVCCCATWLTGMVIALPYPIYTIYVELGVSIRRVWWVAILQITRHVLPPFLSCLSSFSSFHYPPTVAAVPAQIKGKSSDR